MTIKNDTKLKADIAESAVITELLKRSYRVLRPVGDRLPYDLVIETSKGFKKIQIKSAWYDNSARRYLIDTRRCKTNRRRMLRMRYTENDFDFAIVYLENLNIFYVIPISAFLSFKGNVTLLPLERRLRIPKAEAYKDRWDLLPSI